MGSIIHPDHLSATDILPITNQSVLRKSVKANLMQQVRNPVPNPSSTSGEEDFLDVVHFYDRSDAPKTTLVLYKHVVEFMILVIQSVNMGTYLSEQLTNTKISSSLKTPYSAQSRLEGGLPPRPHMSSQRQCKNMEST